VNRDLLIKLGAAALGSYVVASLVTTLPITSALGTSDIPGTDPDSDSPPSGGTVGQTFQANLTGYWPFNPTDNGSSASMEGGTTDRHGSPLYPLEDAISGAAPFCSLSGDPTVFPYGQSLSLDQFPGVVFRVVDTGQHFWDRAKRGWKKVYRFVGREPLDVCVRNSAQAFTNPATVTINAGDTLNASKNDPNTSGQVDTTNLADQTLASNDVSSDDSGDDTASG